jgi:uncharacterized membrane protein
VDFTEAMDKVAMAFEVVGVGVLVVGGVIAFVLSFRGWRAGQEFYPVMRRNFGRGLLLGLEVLVAADIIKTVAVDATLESVLALGVLVVVRVLLSFSLDIEIDGVPPWRRLMASSRVRQTPGEDV